MIDPTGTQTNLLDDTPDPRAASVIRALEARLRESEAGRRVWRTTCVVLLGVALLLLYGLVLAMERGV